MDVTTMPRPRLKAKAAAGMKACRIHAFGPPEFITVEDVHRPSPGEGEMLVRVEAAGAGPWDAWIRAGRSALPQPLPLTLGSDLSGLVVAVGPGVMDFAVGDEVFGATNARFTGAYAEYAVVTAAMMAGKPRSLTHVEAASVPVVAATAWQALFEQARVGPGQRVLIHGAAGNVGAYAVQLAKLAEAHVIATASAADLDFVRGLGADEVIDYRATRFEASTQDIDVVVDLVGGEVQTRSFAVLKTGGMLVSGVSPLDAALAARHGVEARFFLVDVTTMHLTRLAEMIDAGDLEANIGIVLPLSEARIAHRMLEGTQPHPRGKIVLEVGG